MPDQIATQDALHALFHPRAVAVIGVSDDTAKQDYIVLTNVHDTGFTRGIYGISRRFKNVDGLVRVGLRSPEAVAKAYAEVRCHDVILRAMIGGGPEAIAGVTRAGGVGLVLIAGLGGVFANALHDVATFLVSVSRGFIEAGLAKGSLGRILVSRRWKYPGASSAFADLLMSVQSAALALGDTLQAIDINPVIRGEPGAVAVDALVIPCP